MSATLLNGCSAAAQESAGPATFDPASHRYGATEDEAVRKVILGRLGERIDIPQDFVPTLLASADALDAVVACLGARGADLGRQADPPPSAPPAEGWISVEAA